MEARRYKVVRDEKLSGKSDARFVVVDAETGAVLDDAQGYGYKSVQKAHAAYSYKTRDQSKDAAKKANEKKIRAWMQEHKDFVEAMDEHAFDIAKGSFGPDEKFNAAFVKQMLADAGLQTDFTAGNLLRAWQKG